MKVTWLCLSRHENKDGPQMRVYAMNGSSCIRWHAFTSRIELIALLQRYPEAGNAVVATDINWHVDPVPEVFDDSKPSYCVFAMDLRPTPALIAGTLSFHSSSGEVLKEVPCTSGAPGYQTIDHIWTRGAGPCPPVAKQSIRFSSGYHLNTKGIEGWAFPMLPDPIMRNGQVGRAEIMLHRDANVPGTAGCLGVLLSKAKYDEFVLWARKLGDLPLRIEYT